MSDQTNQEYSILEKHDTGEYHIFYSETKADENCYPKFSSICNKMNSSERGPDVKLICGNDDDARRVAAQIGRPVCGTCVSHLYATY